MSEIKKSAKHGNFIIQQAENDSVSIICDNTRQALRDIANEIGMEFDPEWNTRYFGHRLINFINGVDTTRKSKEVEQSNNTDGVSDEDWEWWISLPDVLKYTVLYSFKDVFEKEDISFPEWDSDYDSFADTEFKFTERSTDDVNNAGYWLKVWITGGYEEGEFVDPDEGEFRIIVPSDAWGLNSVEKLAHLKLMVTLDLGEFEATSLPTGIDKLTQLKILNLSDNEFEDPAKEVVQLFPLKNLESLWIKNTGIADDEDLLSQLQEALPDCEIKPYSRPFFY